MDTIDISQNIQDFKQVFEKESRIIFSARFGDGKSYFLNEFMKSYDEKDNDYYFITLHPVNYVVEENRDVIEYIKRDILFQLIKDNRIYDFKEGYDKIFDAVCNKESLLKLADFAASIIPVKGLKERYESLKGLASTIYEKYKEQDVLHVVDDYLNGFYGKSGSISECDAFTYLIQKSLGQTKAKSVLIIEDLDRIDPAHLFRIMNVLSSQVDNPYYSEVPNGNKFGFDKIILVMDYEIARHLFHHFYGKEANYEGYMNKFLNTLPYKFSISEEAQKQVENKLIRTFGTSDVLNFRSPLNPHKFNSDTFFLLVAVKELSVRRCKEFIDDNIETHIKPSWVNDKIKIPTNIDLVKLLYCIRFFTRLSLNTIFVMLIESLEGELAVRMLMPLFCISRKKNTFFVRMDKEIYECHYEESSLSFSVEQNNTWDDSLVVSFDNIKRAASNMKDAVLDLIIGDL